MSNGVLPPWWALNLSPWYGYVYWSHWHTWTGGRTYVRTYVVRTDVHDVMAIKPNFLTSMGYHIFLTMVLRATRCDAMRCDAMRCVLSSRYSPERFIYSRCRLVFLEKRSEGTKFRFRHLCKYQCWNSHLQLPSADNRSPERNNQTAQLPLGTFRF